MFEAIRLKNLLISLELRETVNMSLEVIRIQNLSTQRVLNAFQVHENSWRLISPGSVMSANDQSLSEIISSFSDELSLSSIRAMMLEKRIQRFSKNEKISK